MLDLFPAQILRLVQHDDSWFPFRWNVGSSEVVWLLRLRHFCFLGVLPVPVKGKPSENQQQADGGAARADEPEIDR